MYHEYLGEIYDENDLPPTKLVLSNHEIKRVLTSLGLKELLMSIS